MLVISAGGVISVMFVTEKKSLENSEVPISEGLCTMHIYMLVGGVCGCES